MQSLGAKEMAGEPLEYGTACSGCEVASKIMHGLSLFLRAKLGVSFRPRQIFACELDQDKQRFIREQFPDLGCLFGDVADLGKRKALDVITGRRRWIPSVMVLIAGFSCKSLTPMSKDAAKNKGCIGRVDPDAETSYTYHGIRTYIRSKRPMLLILENVKELMSVGVDGDSDLATVVADLKALRYEVEWFTFDAAAYGSRAARVRIYILGWRVDDDIHLPDPCVWRAFLDKCAIDSQSIHRFVYEDTQELEDALFHLGCPQIPRASSRPRNSGSSGSSGAALGWQTEHLDAYRYLKIDWPLSLDSEDICLYPKRDDESEMRAVRFRLVQDCLTLRELELICLMMVMFPFDDSDAGDAEFFDANSWFSRLCPTMDNGSASPWRTLIPTITGNGRPVIRYRFNDTVTVRLVRGIEAFRLLGWDVTDWHNQCCNFDDAMLLNLVGNAFSGFAVIPMLLISLGRWGSSHAVGAVGVGDTTTEPDHLSVVDSSDTEGE